MKKIEVIILSVAVGTLCAAESHAAERIDSLPRYGVEQKSSQYFRERYQYNDLSHYLDNMDLYTTYQSETTGQYNLADQLIFSLEGNSHKWNSYYLDGFRIDSRFFAGSTLYNVDLYTHDLGINYISSELRYDTNSDITPAITGSYNFGGVGGMAPGTQAFIHLFHDTATDRRYKPFEHRSKVQGAATARANFDINGYKQSVYADFGERKQVFFDQNGIDSFVPEVYGHLQLGGELPTTLGGIFDKTNYLVHYKQRDNLYSESYFNEDETAEFKTFSASLYGTNNRDGLDITSGLTFAFGNINHDNINFSRNIIDQDGEAFDPWYPDGNNYEFSHSTNLSKVLNSWLKLKYDGYNSLIYNDPSKLNFENLIYHQQVEQKSQDMLYIYNWSANSFWSGLLENTAGLSASRQLSPAVQFNGDLNLTLDAMLLGGGKSMVRPNYEVQLGFAIDPSDWFSMEVTLGRKRVAFNYDEIKYMSDDYLNGDIYYATASGERGDYFTSTGGAYHTAVKGLNQPSYLFLDIPLNFTFGRHRISLLQSYRSYKNNWHTSYDKSAEEYGSYVDIVNEVGDGEFDSCEVYFLNGGEQINYVVGGYPEGIMGDSFLTRTPFYFCSNAEYQYVSPKFMFALGWQSYMMGGLATLGNGPLHNNIGALSESSANPNTQQREANKESVYKAAGRLDQDRAYVARIFTSYNINDHLSLAMNLKFKDGQPFSTMRAELLDQGSGSTQAAIYPSSTKGTNPLDGNFGTREDAFFNVDFRATYRWQVAERNFEFQLNCYNMYDFGTELTEYVFDQELDFMKRRRAMSQSIPRGFILSLKVDL